MIVIRKIMNIRKRPGPILAPAPQHPAWFESQSWSYSSWDQVKERAVMSAQSVNMNANYNTTIRNRNVFNLFILKYIFSWSSLHGERFLLKIIIKIDKKLFVTFILNINNMKLSYWPVDVATILIHFSFCYGSSHFTVYFLKRVLKRLAIVFIFSKYRFYFFALVKRRPHSTVTNVHNYCRTIRFIHTHLKHEICRTCTPFDPMQNREKNKWPVLCHCSLAHSSGNLKKINRFFIQLNRQTWIKFILQHFIIFWHSTFKTPD